MKALYHQYQSTMLFLSSGLLPMQFLPPNSGARRANGQKYAPDQAVSHQPLEIEISREGRRLVVFGGSFLWLTTGYTKYCNSGHVSVMISQAVKELGRAHRRNIRLSKSWSFLYSPPDFRGETHHPAAP